jgi:uncharacterized protein (DUF362 family)
MMERRDFIKKAGQAAALAVAAGGIGYFFNKRETSRALKIQRHTTNFRVLENNQFPKVALAKNIDHTKALKSSLEAVGGIERFIRPGERITIKPNIGWDRAPEQAANTNPQLVAAMVQLCLAAGASKVIVTDISCNDPRRCFFRSGIKEAAEKAGATVILPAETDFIDIDFQGDLLTVWPVLKPFIETDRFINMPIVKQHSLTGCTIGMKNLYGILGGRRNQLHQEIDRSIVDLVAFCRPTLTVIDATRILTHGGPQGGSLDDVITADTVICATDPVAADSRAAEFLGLRGEQVGHIVLAEKRGLGAANYQTAGYKEIGT